MAGKNGAFIPTWQRYNHETGEMEFGLDPDDFEAIRQGYGCPACLADFHGVYLRTCPTCGHSRRDSGDIVPQWWTSRSII